jgi:PleD family two-component response regulator
MSSEIRISVPDPINAGVAVAVSTLIASVGSAGLDALLAEAGVARYLAKHSGRNRLESRILGAGSDPGSG